MNWLVLLCALAPAVTGSLFGEIKDAKVKGGNIWAVLVAGSNTWDNYRHQADICHAYQIFARHGVPKENIIVFMTDDIAQNEQNPDKGVIINKPNGTNVYPGVNKDYIGNDVTPKNFLAAITGDGKTVNGKKVLKSGPNDHVFIYFADHGGTGELCFPNYDCTLYADDLNKAIVTMYKKKMFSKLLFYVEACEAGSMFANLLPDNINVIVTTASNPSESSWGTYCVNPLNTCLGDEYSVAWMQDTDEAEGGLLKTETIERQFEDVVKHTADSHPQMYGQTSLKNDYLKDYIGISKKSFKSEPQIRPKDSVPSREIYLHNLNQKIENTKDDQRLKELQDKRTAYLQGRQMIDSLFANIMARAGASDDEINSRKTLNMGMFPCYKNLTQAFRDTCVNTNQNGYVVGHHYKLANLCLRDNFDTKETLEIFAEECKEHHRKLSGIN